VSATTTSTVYGEAEDAELELGPDEHAARARLSTAAPSPARAHRAPRREHPPSARTIKASSLDPSRAGSTRTPERLAEPYHLCIPNATTSSGQPGRAGAWAAPPALFDIHQHCGPVPGWPSSLKRGADGRGADECALRLEIMDRFGIDQACLQPSNSYEPPRGPLELARLNDAVHALQHQAPTRFPAAFGTVDLNHGTAAAVKEAGRVLDDLGFHGLAWHHRLQGTYIDDPRMRPVLDMLAERRKIAAIHIFSDSTFEAPWRLENLAEEYRGVQFIAMDAFSSYDHACWMSRIASHHPNVVFDTAAMTTSANVLARFVADAGPERLLLGTNLYGLQQTDYYPAALAIIRASTELDAVAKDLVLGQNARRLLHVDPV
jgi:predicted TIM-barrel fold metal-dependent hydrolase